MPYGLFYYGMHERFERFGELAGTTLVRPGGASYRVPVINGIALFPWRFAGDPGKRMQDTEFANSGARAEVQTLPRKPVQGTLDLDLGRSSELIPISDAPALAGHFERIVAAPEIHPEYIVLVAINSSVHELHSVEWGLAVPAANRRLVWSEHHEHLLPAHRFGPASTTQDRKFSDGKIPRRLPRDGDDAVDTQGDR